MAAWRRTSGLKNNWRTDSDSFAPEEYLYGALLHMLLWMEDGVGAEEKSVGDLQP